MDNLVDVLNAVVKILEGGATLLGAWALLKWGNKNAVSKQLNEIAVIKETVQTAVKFVEQLHKKTLDNSAKKQIAMEKAQALLPPNINLSMKELEQYVEAEVQKL